LTKLPCLHVKEFDKWFDSDALYKNCPINHGNCGCYKHGCMWDFLIEKLSKRIIALLHSPVCLGVQRGIEAGLISNILGV